MNNISWLFKGLSTFGLCVGLYVGLSVSPIVNSVVSLMFAFIGGSIILLIRGRSVEELSIIGKSVFMISIFMIIGSVVGVLVREGWSEEGLSLNEVMNDDEFVRLICDLSKKKIDEEKICVIAKRYKFENLSLSDLKTITGDTKIKPLVLSAMLDKSTPCFDGDVSDIKQSGFELHSGSVKK